MSTTIVRDPSPDARELSVRMVAATQEVSPGDIIDATINVLGIHMVTHALLTRKTRGEAKAFFRKCAEDAMAMALANYDAAQNKA